MLTEEEKRLIIAHHCEGLSPAERELYIHVCETRGLSPLLGQINAMRRYSQAHGDYRMSIQVSIDGMRLIADRTGKRDGYSGPEWCGTDGQWRDIWAGEGYPYAARIAVYRAGCSHPFTGIAYWEFYAGKKKGGDVTHFWAKGGCHMLAKCAEALALRMAFPENLSGLYTNDEMHQAAADATQASPSEPAAAIPELVAPEEDQTRVLPLPLAKVQEKPRVVSDLRDPLYKKVLLRIPRLETQAQVLDALQYLNRHFAGDALADLTDRLNVRAGDLLPTEQR